MPRIVCADDLIVINTLTSHVAKEASVDAIAPKFEMVELPNGATVVICDTREDWWSTSESSGYLNPDLLAPDPDQPREHMNEIELAEFQENIASVGVRQSLTVTPRELVPWVILDPAYEGRPFVIVSGHRRWTCATRAKIRAVPVQIRFYSDEYDYLEEASVLNTGQAKLTDLEKGRELVRLRSKSNGKIKIEDLAKRSSLSVQQVYLRMALTRLDPEIQDLLSPKISEKRRLPSTVGGVLGGVKVPEIEELLGVYEELALYTKGPLVVPEETLAKLDEDGRRYALQRLLLTVIRVNRLNTPRAIDFIRNHALKLRAAASSAGRRPERYRIGKRLEILRNLLKSINGSAVLDWTPEEMARVFAATTNDQLTDLERSLRDTSQLVSRLQQYAANAKVGRGVR